MPRECVLSATAAANSVKDPYWASRPRAKGGWTDAGITIASTPLRTALNRSE